MITDSECVSSPLAYLCLSVLFRFASIPARMQEQIKRTASGSQANGAWLPYASPAAAGMKYRRSGKLSGYWCQFTLVISSHV